MNRYRLIHAARYFNVIYKPNCIFIQCSDEDVINQYTKDIISQTYKKHLLDNNILGYFKSDKDMRLRWINKASLEKLN